MSACAVLCRYASPPLTWGVGRYGAVESVGDAAGRRALDDAFPAFAGIEFRPRAGPRPVAGTAGGGGAASVSTVTCITV